MSYEYISFLVENHRFIPNANSLVKKAFESIKIFSEDKSDQDNLLHVTNILLDQLQSKVPEDISFFMECFPMILTSIPVSLLDTIVSKVLVAMKTYLKTTDLERQMIALKVLCKLFERMRKSSNTVIHETVPKCKEIIYILMDNIANTKNTTAIINNFRALALVIYLLKGSVKSIIPNIEERILPYFDHFDSTVRELAAITIAYTYSSDKNPDYFNTKLNIILNTIHNHHQFFVGKPYESSLPLLIPLPLDMNSSSLSLNFACNRMSTFFTLLTYYTAQPAGLGAPLSFPLPSILQTFLPFLSYYVPVADRTIDISSNGTSLPPNQQVHYVHQLYIHVLDYFSLLVPSLGSSLYIFSSSLIAALTPFLDRILRDNNVDALIHTFQFLSVLYTTLPALYRSVSSSSMITYLNIFNYHLNRCENKSIVIQDLHKRKSQNKKKNSKVHICITNPHDMKSRDSTLVTDEPLDYPWLGHSRYPEVFYSLLEYLNTVLLKCSISISLEERQQLDVLLWNYIHQFYSSPHYNLISHSIHLDDLSTLKHILTLVHSSILSPYPNGYMSPLLPLSSSLFDSMSTVTNDSDLKTMCSAYTTTSYLLLHAPSPHIWIHSNIPTVLNYSGEAEVKEAPQTTVEMKQDTPVIAPSTSSSLDPSKSLNVPLPSFSLPTDSIFFSDTFTSSIKREIEEYKQEQENAKRQQLYTAEIPLPSEPPKEESKTIESVPDIQIPIVETATNEVQSSPISEPQPTPQQETPLAPLESTPHETEEKDIDMTEALPEEQAVAEQPQPEEPKEEDVVMTNEETPIEQNDVQQPPPATEEPKDLEIDLDDIELPDIIDE